MRLAQVASSSTEEALEALGPFFPGVHMEAPGERTLHFELESYAAHGLVLVDYVIDGPAVRARTNADGIGVVNLDMRGEMFHRRQALDLLRPIVVPSEVDAVIDHAHARVLQLDVDRIQRFARADGAGPGGRIQVLDAAPISDDAARVWRATARFAEDRLRDGSADVPLIGSALTDLVIATFLQSFRTTWLDLTPSDGEGAVTAPVRRARVFIEEHAHRAIGVAEIAEAAGLSVRGLQSAFQRQLGRTPLEYLRLVRLHGARGDLLAGDPTAGATVAAVANRWGFVHLGRFARQYRDAFGETPATTLRR